MDRISEARREADAKLGNEQTFTRKLMLQLMRQNSLLTAVEAARQARELYYRGVRDLWE